MTSSEIGRLLRGAVRNAVVWGIGWFAISFVLVTVASLAGLAPAGAAWLDGVGMALKAGFIGGIAGGAFAIAIGVLYRGRRLADISWVRFGIGGGIITGLFIPTFLQLMNVLSGDGMVPMALVADDAVLGLVLGAVLAGGSLWLAQRAESGRGVGGGSRLDGLGEGDPFGRSIDPVRKREEVDRGE